MHPPTLYRHPIHTDVLNRVASEGFGDMAKAVIDLGRGFMTLGGEMHADGEQILLDDGSKQEDLWGINLYPERLGDERIVFESMINIRPWQQNRSRFVEDPSVQDAIRAFLADFILP